MSPAEVVAYIGAAAWLPHIGSWLYKALAKPKLSVRSAPTVDLRYDEHGPTVRFTFSLSAERSDAIIDSVELHVRHEHGDERTMRWMQVGEISGDTDVPATALKVTTDGLVDRRVIFQDLEFSSEIQKHIESIMAQFNFLRTSESDPMQALLKSKEVHEAKEHFAQGCYWKPGAYTLEVSLTCRGRNHCSKFLIKLPKADADLLKQGSELFGEYVSSSVMASIGTPTAAPVWRWVTLPINLSR